MVISFSTGAVRWFRGTGLSTVCPAHEWSGTPAEWAVVNRVRFGRYRGKLRCTRCAAFVPSESHPILKRTFGGW